MEKLMNGNLELLEFFNEFRKLYDEPLMDIHTLLTVEIMLTKRIQNNCDKIDAELERLNKEIG